MAMLPSAVLVPALCKAGAWKSPAAGSTISAWSVCRSWRDALWGSPAHVAALLAEVHGQEHALIRAASCSSHMVDRCALVRQVLLTVRADCLDGMALVMAARNGHEAVVRLLLEWPQHAPHADCQNRAALMEAAEHGHDTVVRLLLQWPCHAPRADSQGAKALTLAAHGGHAAAVRVLLQHLQHASPRHAAYMQDRVLPCAAAAGHDAVVQMLLDWLACSSSTGLDLTLFRAAEAGRVAAVRQLLPLWPQRFNDADIALGRALVQSAAGGHVTVVESLLDRAEIAPRSVGWCCCTLARSMTAGWLFGSVTNWHMSKAMVGAARGGHEEVVRLLLRRQQPVPHAVLHNARALVQAAKGGHEAVVRLLLHTQHHHVPFADVRNGRALVHASKGGHEAVVRMLLEAQEFTPAANFRISRALAMAAKGRHHGVMRLLREYQQHLAPASYEDRAVEVCRVCLEVVVQLLLQWQVLALLCTCVLAAATNWCMSQ